ncbi:hypothetical protein LU604_25150 [Erwinia tracheiphila]|uniref:Uncharacterized protein n=1 Tax=Erwinia tracheiphila TaxID=65700 RepID=A0A345CWJ0_9GAMM|nr:hypothetical protein [Erwinia tracheiphila]AXF77807.1 hypothetical protein AV903_20010 [Erwinia tracheiphila]UIA83493.1 hypothetical protein LU604_25150 [Erwinia tracheiphila]UIA92077.1 hypothetical protein LU632_24615 [Erwinia tracheiphila]
MFNLLVDDLKGEIFFWLCLAMSFFLWFFISPNYFVPLGLFSLIFGRIFFEVIVYKIKNSVNDQ